MYDGQFSNVTFGCAYEPNFGWLDTITTGWVQRNLGLSLTDGPFFTQLVYGYNFNTMSYCLGDETSTNWISFGGHLNFSPLIDKEFYGVNLKDITIEDTFIDT